MIVLHGPIGISRVRHQGSHKPIESMDKAKGPRVRGASAPLQDRESGVVVQLRGNRAVEARTLTQGAEMGMQLVAVGIAVSPMKEE